MNDSVPIIYFLQHPATPNEVKIGKTVLARLRTRYNELAAMGPLDVLALLRVPSGSTEKDFFRNFARYHIERERYQYRGRLKAYVEYVRERPWAATSLETADSAYPAPQMFPWQEMYFGDAEFLDGERLFDPGPAFRDSVPESLSDDWQTAPLYIAAVKDVLGEIDLDPCSNVIYNDTSVKATAIWTIHDDGLRHPWRGRIWMNPPFGGAAGEWVAKLLHEFTQGRCREAIYTLPTRATSNGWFMPLWDYPLCVTHHRPFFRHPDGTWGSAPGGHVFGYLGHQTELFLERFREFGATFVARPPLESARASLRARAGWNGKGTT